MSPRKISRRSSARVQFFSDVLLADGRVAYVWKPSPRLRRLGHTMQHLGMDYATALAKAVAINADIASDHAPAGKPAITHTKNRWTLRDLIKAYQESPEYLTKAAATQREYRSQCRWLEAWGGDFLVRDFDPEMMETLVATLKRQSSPYVTVARMRMASILFAYAIKPLRIIAVNPASKLGLPQRPARTKRITIDTLEWLVSLARERRYEHLALALDIGFYTTQREGDLLDATRLNYRPMFDMAGEDRATLADSDGVVMGLRILQKKTQRWLDLSLPSTTRDLIDNALTRRRILKLKCTNIILHPDDDRACPSWQFQRDFRAFVEEIAIPAAARQAGEDSELVAHLTGLQFRDIRRSGMCWLRDMGATVAQIAMISGHHIAYTQKILDTYMPTDGRAAAAGLGHALRAMDRQRATKQTA